MKTHPVPFDELPDSGYVRQAQIIPAVLPISASGLWRKVKAGEFPQPHKLGANTTAWRVGDVRRYLNECATVVA